MTTVVVTRPQSSIEQTTKAYQQAGFDVFASPCFDIQTCPMVETSWLIAPADVWVILSVHALQHALKIVPDLKPLTETKIIAVGPAVIKAWQQHSDHPIISDPLMNSEGVISILKNEQPQSVKILTTGDGRNLIKIFCMNHQISYSQINTYQRIPLPLNAEAMTELYTEQTVILTATSVGILQHLVAQFSDELKAKACISPLVVGAKRIAEAAQSLGFKSVYVAKNPSDEAMIQEVSMAKI